MKSKSSTINLGWKTLPPGAGSPPPDLDRELGQMRAVDAAWEVVVDDISIYIIVFLTALWFFLLRTRATRLESRAEFEALLAGGRPVVVDFFSNT